MLNAVPAPARILGLAGLIPFVACAAASWMGPPWLQAEAISLQLGYGAVIVTFLGGVHWGRALAPDSTVDWPRLSWSVLPSLIAWVALRMYPLPALAVLIAAFALAFFVDRQSIRSGFFPEWYLPLRRLLTLGAMACLIVTLARVAALPA